MVKVVSYKQYMQKRKGRRKPILSGKSDYDCYDRKIYFRQKLCEVLGVGTVTEKYKTKYTLGWKKQWRLAR